MTDRHGPTRGADLVVPEGTGLVTLAAARVHRAVNAAPYRRIPSLYADPAAWALLEAVDELWAGRPDEPREPETTATILVSTHGTLDTVAGIARAVPGGRLSALRFAGAGAGAPVSLVCMVHGLRGPSLTLTTDPARGLPAALTTARHWLRTGAAGHVVVAVHEHDPLHGHDVRCVVVGAAPAPHPSGAPR
ncbi:hypothetical protein [Streptomyces sp. OM5714]|uniref:hypothetical protein n=1 Tax=Streptomyces sp. OM5714 TaxID=2602736 RepID=UPI0013D92CB6|nr:hypothetical protein [Streptomyces sp. OM5714]